MSIHSSDFANGMEQLAKKLFHHFHPTVEGDEKRIQKGLFLYRQGAIYDTGYDPQNRMIRAKARDVYQVNVRISLDPEKGSSCSCPEEDWCRHRLATFFKMYQEVDSVGQWVNRWRNQKTVSFMLEKSPLAWREFVRESVDKIDFSMFRQQPSLFENYGMNLVSTLRKQAPMEKEWKPLYELHTSFWLFVYIVSRTEKDMGMPYYEHYFTPWLESLVESMEDAVADLAVYARPFAFDPFLTDMRKGSRQLLESHPGSIVFSVYSLLWFQLFTNKAWREQELTQLQESKETAKEIGFAKTAMLLLLGRVEWKTEMKETDATVVPHAVRWMEWLTWEERGEMATDILKSLPPKVKSFMDEIDRDAEQRSFAYWLLRRMELARGRMQSQDALVALYESLLPFSARHLGSLLLDTGRYREWVELVHWIGFQPDELEAAGFSKLIEQRPEHAVPLLHQWIEELIAQKQRDSYKRAVRYLKKLKKIYWQSKQMARWEMYFQATLEKNRRLRAFQEECKRGKLIHVDQ